MTFAEVHVKRSVILTDRLGPDILLALRMKGQECNGYVVFTFLESIFVVNNCTICTSWAVFLLGPNQRISDGGSKVAVMLLLVGWLFLWYTNCTAKYVIFLGSACRSKISHSSLFLMPNYQVHLTRNNTGVFSIMHYLIFSCFSCICFFEFPVLLSAWYNILGDIFLFGIRETRIRSTDKWYTVFTEGGTEIWSAVLNILWPCVQSHWKGPSVGFFP